MSRRDSVIVISVMDVLNHYTVSILFVNLKFVSYFRSFVPEGKEDILVKDGMKLEKLTPQVQQLGT